MRRLVALLWLGAALAGPAAAQTNEYLATLGAAGVSGADDAHFNLPQGIAYDAANGHILVADSANDRVQVFNASDHAFVATIGQTDNPGSGNGNFMQGNRVKKFVTKGKNAESVLILESVGGDSDGRRHGLVRGGL